MDMEGLVEVVCGGEWRCMEEFRLWIFDCGWMGKGRRRDERMRGFTKVTVMLVVEVCLLQYGNVHTKVQCSTKYAVEVLHRPHVVCIFAPPPH